MKKKINFHICLIICALLISCTGPGTGPGGMYTEGDRYRDQTNTAIAIGATAVGAAIVGSALYNAGRYNARYYYHPHPRPGYVHRAPAYRPPRHFRPGRYNARYYYHPHPRPRYVHRAPAYRPPRHFRPPMPAPYRYRY